MATSRSVVTSTSTRTFQRTTTERLPDGTVKTKTIIEKTTPDGRTTTEEVTSVGKTQASNSKPKENQGTDRKKSIGRFTVPKFFGANFFQSSGPKSNEPKVSLASADTGPIQLPKYRQELLRLQNTKRSQHGVSDLVISENLNSVAQEWAEHLAKNNMMQHRPRSQYGENIFMGYNSSGTIPANQPIDSWYSEIKQYDYDRPSTSCGHFTQMVWKDSKEVGFGCATSKNETVYVVANYFPAGNMVGKFKENVLRPKK